MTSDAVHGRQHSARWMVAGAVLALVGLAAVVISLVVGNVWEEEGGTEQGALQAGILIPGAIALGVGVVLLVIGMIKRRPKRGDDAGITRER